MRFKNITNKMFTGASLKFSTKEALPDVFRKLTSLIHNFPLYLVELAKKLKQISCHMANITK